MDAVRNIVLAALGAVGYSQDKLKEALDSLIERGQLTKEQGESVIQEWVNRGESERDKLSDRISNEVGTVMQRLSLVTREEFEALTARVDELEKKSGG